MDRIATQDKTWVHSFDTKTKGQSIQWKHTDSRTSLKFKVAWSSKNVMASVFWDREVLVMIDYIEKGSTINGKYYAD